MKNENGQTLIEVLAALSVMVIILTSITVAVLTALSNTTNSKNQNVATLYAQQGMEAMRSLRVINYATFNGLSGTYCLAKSCATLDSSQPALCWQQSQSPTACAGNIDNFFTRTVFVPTSSIKCTGSTKEIQVVVAWSDGRCAGGALCRQAPISSCFSNATTVQVP